MTHMKIHSEVSEYTCDMCGKAFKIRASLTKHISITHFSKERPKKVCPDCGKSVFDLKSHIKQVHTTVKTMKVAIIVGKLVLILA